MHPPIESKTMCSPYPLRPGEADCRDYLRTGRCKYGESCKYNHPPNVESGGGVKPLNPSEPLFPIRPGEPACQYFLKHGTCKFGQSCKFNHPPLSEAGVGGGGGLPAGQLVFVTTPGDVASSHVMATSSVQVLPQRPTEPNCIYFLRNGKCKYGATCKFHHPLDAINRNNQAQGRSLGGRDRSLSVGSSSSDGRPPVQPVQHGVTYATTANVTYVQPQRLRPITERVRPQQPTHILLPDGQIAVILDPQSLQNVNELGAQDRPKFYLSQADGSIGTLPSVEQSNNTVVVSPMLTATTTSTSQHTFDSSIDLMGTNVVYQAQARGEQSRGPNKSGSGGSLSAFGSLDSGQQGDHVALGASQLHSGQVLSSSLGGVSFPEYAEWPNEGLDQASQAQPRRMALDRQRHPYQNLESTNENTAVYWPVNGSFSSIPVTDRDIQGGRTYASSPNASHYGSNYSVGQAIQRPYSAGRGPSVSPSASSDRMQGRHSAEPRGSSGDDEGLTMMTSALLTMMDRHDDSTCSDNDGSAGKSPSRGSMGTTSRTASSNTTQGDGGHSPPIELGLREGASPLRPPPGMGPPGLGPPGMPSIDATAQYSSSGFGLREDFERSRSPPGGGYFIGGYDQSSSRTPPWGR